MKNRHKKGKNCEVDVVFSISGRLRLRAAATPKDPAKLLNELQDATKITKGSYSSITNTFVFEYDKDITDLNKLILNFCGLYARDLGKKSVKVNYILSKKHTMGYSSIVSVAFILTDMGLNALGFGNRNRYRNFIRWCSVGTTVGAIFEHGYRELNQNGAFDPEVMSIMYLFNAIHKGTAVEGTSSLRSDYSPAIAWLLTFGRHILTRKNRSINIAIVENNGEIKVIEEENKAFFFNQFIGSCFDVYQNVSVKRALR